VIQIYTGNGKGKTTAALGLVIRALGRGKKVCIIQFMKKNFTYGEIVFLSEQKNVKIFQFGTDKLIDPKKPKAIDIEEASKAIARSYNVIKEDKYDILVLDEINVAVEWRLITVDEQLKIFDMKPEMEIIMTGRYARKSVIDKADLVTEMKEVKHYYSQGLEARIGIEY